MKRLFAAACAALALLAAPVMAADQPSVYLWVSFVKAKPGQGDALVGEMIKEDSKVFDVLVDSGQATDWGIAMPMIHDGGDPYSHVEWVSFVGWAGADAFMKKFMEVRQSMGAEGNKAMADRWATLVEPGSHADLVAEHLHVGKGRVMPGSVKYIDLSYWRANPGRFGDMRRNYMENMAPVLDKLVADGTIINYGLSTPEYHRGQGWDFMSWTLLDSLGAMDKAGAGFDAANAARTDEQREALRKRNQENSDWSGHSDQILMVVHHKVAAPK